MNNKLIEKIISCNDGNSCEFTYSNPLLDRNVTKSLSTSFVKLLNISKDNNENNNLRHTVLENIRKICKIEPEGHMNVNEDVTEILTSFYEQQIGNINNTQALDVNKQLDAFLIRKWKETNINTSFKSNVNPEVAQALMNLNEKIDFKSTLVEDIIHWNQHDRKYSKVLKEIWNRSNIDEANCDKHNKRLINIYDDTSIKFKPEIEKWLLEILCAVLEDNSFNVDDLILSNSNYGTLIKYCSVSAECFQMCISILNCVFIKTNLQLSVQKLICSFVTNVKLACKVTISVLYPTHLSHLINLLDINLDELPVTLRQNYVQNAQKYLKKLYDESETDLIMLLSHFPQWYTIYFK